jgi:RNA polymerase sigma-70 factor, ECF subfamily
VFDARASAIGQPTHGVVTTNATPPKLSLFDFDVPRWTIATTIRMNQSFTAGMAMQRSPEDIFAILVRDHELGLLAFVTAHVAEDAAAMDIVQETFLAAWSQIERFDQTESFSRYLRGIAHHKIADHYRIAYTERHRLEPLPEEHLTGIAAEFERQVPDDTELFEARLTALRACIETLNGPVRAIVDQHYRVGRSCSDIGTAIGRGVEAVKKSLQRARHSLFRCIQKRLAAEVPHVV